MNSRLTFYSAIALIGFLLTSLANDVCAQTNNGLNYQAVIRNANNSLVTNRQINVRISILRDSINGTAVFSELHQTNTNANGLISIEIGSGSVLSGNFNSIAWHEGPFFIKSETAPLGDNDFSIVGTSKILNAPLALHSKTAEKIVLPNMTAGDMMYFDGTNWVRIPKGSTRQILTMSSSGVPVWQNLTGYSVPTAPSVTTLPPSNLSTSGAQMNATVNANGYLTTTVFEYGPTIQYGSEIAATPSPAAGDTIFAVSASLTGLPVITTYHYRVKASNQYGISYGGDMIFSTLGNLPVVTIIPATNVLSNSAVFNAIVNPNGSSTNVFVEYGSTSSLGLSSAMNENPITGFSNTPLSISLSLSSFPIGTTIYYRIRATNPYGTSYSSIMSFLLKPAIGELYAGGMVFFVNETGTGGYVCTMTDQSLDAQWGCTGTLCGATSAGLGFGSSNTEIIVGSCNETNCAARICSDLVYNTYDDWFLPSNAELSYMYSNLKANGLGDFATARYWSSTELNANNAYDCLFYNGEISTFAGIKINQKHVRAVRAFGN